ncbi:hypothetical protein [Phytoactinopolyspora limicola]|uniref:hypothetical protein n=1 Tax=Phytoactinopolyspora limicola TaxID=2715536 RepID=UPI001408827F|nr:hypothetical protein [Phytoactinopolyspora limicola]
MGSTDVATAIRDAVALPWGGERNLALRAALELVEGEIGLVNRGEVVQLVVDTHRRANELVKLLAAAFPGWTTRVNTNSDRRYVVHAYESDEQLAAAEAALRQLHGQMNAKPRLNRV